MVQSSAGLHMRNGCERFVAGSGQAASSGVGLKQPQAALARRAATFLGSDTGSNEQLMPLPPTAASQRRQQLNSPAADQKSSALATKRSARPTVGEESSSAADQEPGALATKRSARPTAGEESSSAADQEPGALATKRSARPTVSKATSPAAERKLRLERTPHAAETQKGSAATAAVAGSGADLGCGLEAALAQLTAEIAKFREEQHASKAGNSHADCEQ